VPSLRDLYAELVDKCFFDSKERREFLEAVALEAVEEGIRERKLVIVRAPPGIGKTAISTTLAASTLTGLIEEYLQLIHVVPTRALIEDLRSRVLDGFSRVLGDEELARKIVVRQYGLAHEAPYLSGFFIATTYDTYFYNIVKIPPDELRKIASDDSLGHYEIPRASILSSINAFDEVHLILEEGKEAAKSYLAIIRFLCETETPPILLTATLPSKVLERVKALSSRGVVPVDYDIKSYPAITRDSFYIRELGKVLEPVDEGLISLSNEDKNESLIGKIYEFVEKTIGRTAIVVNTIEEAKKYYRELRKLDYRPILLTSRLTPEDKEKKVKYVKENYSRVILISTQVIEVGVDLSFDVMISELAPPSSLVQRFGRLARHRKDEYGLWLVYYSRETLEHGSHVYDPSLVSCCGRYLKEILNNGPKIHWHLPEVYDLDSRLVGYMRLIDRCWPEYGCVDSPHIFEALADPTVNSRQVLNYIKGSLREENLCTLYLLQPSEGCPENLKEFLTSLNSRGISMPCEKALMYVKKVLRAYGEGSVKEIKYDRSGHYWSSKLKCEKLDQGKVNRLREYLNRHLYLPETLAIGIPVELYEQGVFGEGLRDL
jgi:CRISPR-associated endonuclease/helicase Cas3